MKLVLFGSVYFSRVMLETAVEHLPEGLDLAAVFGIPPKHSAGISDYADLAPVAERARIHYYPFKKVNAPEVLRQVARIEPDVTFVFGLSQLLWPELLSLTGLTIGTHPTLLPDGRGRAAIPWSIILGWEKSGITFFGITEGVDEGDIYEQEGWAIEPRDDAEILYNKMCRAGQRALKRLLCDLAEGTLKGRPQGQPEIGPLPKRTPADGRIDWTKPADEIDRLIRATTRPYPGAYTFAGPDIPADRLILWKSAPPVENTGGAPGEVIESGPGGFTVAAGSGAVRVTEAQFEGVRSLGPDADFSKFVPVGAILGAGRIADDHRAGREQG